MYNPAFYLLAYERIQAKPGNMTAGSDGKTIDGMSMKRIEVLIQKLKDFFQLSAETCQKNVYPKSKRQNTSSWYPVF